MPNRAQRRRIMREETKRNQAMIAEYTRDQRIAGLIQNGITPEDVRQEYERGRQDGFKQAVWPIIKTCYAAIGIALKEEFGFGMVRIHRALRAVDDKLIFSLGHQELIEELLEKSGIEINFDEPFDRVRMKEEKQ